MSKNLMFKSAKILLSLHAIFWFIVSIYLSFFKYSNQFLTLKILLFLGSALFIGALFGLIKKIKIIYLISIIYLIFVTVFSLFDQLGYLDIIYAVFSAITLINLISIHKEFIQINSK